MDEIRLKLSSAAAKQAADEHKDIMTSPTDKHVWKPADATVV